MRELDVPDCGCPVFDRCPECGAADGQKCICTCKLCDAEWPDSAGHCPNCGVPAKPFVLYQPNNPARPRRIRKMVLRLKCPRATMPRPVRPPCQHVLARDHDLTIEEWAELLLGVHYNEHADRPPPPKWELTIRRSARVTLLRIRWRDGYGLWHPGDLEQSQADDVSTKSAKTANGRVPKELGLTTRKGE